MSDFDETGLYSIQKKKQFKATFSCSTCHQEAINTTNTTTIETNDDDDEKLKQTNTTLISEASVIAPSLETEEAMTSLISSNDTDINDEKNVEDISSVTSVDEYNEAIASAAVPSELPDDEYLVVKSHSSSSDNDQNVTNVSLHVTNEEKSESESKSFFRCYILAIMIISIIFGSITTVLFYKVIRLMYQWKEERKVKSYDVLTYGNEDDDFDDLIEYQKIKNIKQYFQKNQQWEKMLSDDPEYMKYNAHKN